MIPLFDEPLVPGDPGELPTETDHLARTAYLAAVQAAQQHCEALITAARTAYIQAEHRAWTTYQATSEQAVRAWLSPPGDGLSRWFTPGATTHPYAQKDT